MDSATPPHAAQPAQDPPAYVYGPADIYPRGPREEELCAAADHPDWLYLGGLLALDVGSIYLSSFQLKYAHPAEVRQIGPALIGLTFGATFGGGYLALPKCEPHWVTQPPREGEVRTRWPMAISLAMVSAIVSPIVMGVATGPLPLEWTTEERTSRVLVAAGFGFVGALVPYLLPPRTYRAARELENLRLGVDARGASLRYTLSF